MTRGRYLPTGTCQPASFAVFIPRSNYLAHSKKNFHWTSHCTLDWTQDFNFNLPDVKADAPKDSLASGCRTLNAFLTIGPKKSPPSSTATTPEPDNPGISTPESLSSISSISPRSEQALHSPTYIDVTIYNFSSLVIDRDIKFALLDNPNKPPLQVWPYEFVTKQAVLLP